MTIRTFFRSWCTEIVNNNDNHNHVLIYFEDKIIRKFQFEKLLE